MGKFDNLDKVYFGRKEHLAELISQGIYRGRVPVTEGELTLLKAEYPSAKNGERRRDILAYAGKHRIKYGFEIENYADYGMPMRVMEYDMAEYDRDAEGIRLQHEKAGDYENFIERKSGLKKADRFVPVLTTVLYLGTGHYMGRVTLKECLQIPKKMLPYVNEKIQNYTFQVIEADYVNPDDYSTELRQFFKAMQCRDKKEKLARLFAEEEFQNLTFETQKIIAVHLDNKLIERKVIEEEKPMCKALIEWEREAKEEGKEEGKEESNLASISKLVKNLSINVEKAMALLEIPVEDRERYMELLKQ